jgi:O-antigen ligase
MLHSVQRAQAEHLAVQARRPVMALAALLGMLFLSAAISAAVHPSAHAGFVLTTLTASIGLSMFLAMRAPRQAIPILLAAGTLTAVLLLVWVIVVDPALAGTKTPLIRGPLAQWLLSLHVTAGRGIAHPNLAGVVAALVVPGWLALAINSPSPLRGTDTTPRACVPAAAWVGEGVSRTSAKRIVTRVAGSCLLGLSVATLVMSGSRGGMIAALAGAAIVVVLRYRRSIWILPAGLTIGVAALLGPWGIGGTVLRLLTVGSGNDQGRLPVWAASLHAIWQSPWTGRGIGSFPSAYVRMPGGDAFANGTHNTFLQVWLDFGLLGLVALCGLAGLLLLTCARAPRREWATQAMAGIAVAWLLVSLVESTVIVSWRTAQPWQGFQEAVAPLAFALWGLAAAVSGGRDSEEGQS